MSLLKRLMPLVDTTGEVAGTLTYLVRVRPKRGKVFFMLDHESEAMEKLLRLKLPGSVLSVFMYALTHVGRRNVVVLGLRDVGAAVGLTDPQVSVALARLCREGALVSFRGELRREFMVNPAFGWNGHPSEFHEGLERWESLVATPSRQRQLSSVNAEVNA